MNVNVSIPFLLWETGLVYGINNRRQHNNGDLQLNPSYDDSDSEGSSGAFGGPKQHGVMSDSDYQRHNGSGIINQNASQGNGPVRYNGSGIINQNSSQGNGPFRDGPSPNPRFPEMFGVNPEAFKLPRKPSHESHVSGPAKFPSDSHIDDAGTGSPNNSRRRDMINIYEEELSILEEGEEQRREEWSKRYGKRPETSNQPSSSQSMPFPKVSEPGVNRDRWPETEFLQKLEEFKEMVMHHLNVDPRPRDSSSSRFNGPHGYGGLYGSQACGDPRRFYFDPCSNPRMYNKFARNPGENAPGTPIYGLKGGFPL
jgi:hypothetical protein